jgi:catechol 2,3-dioxygenase-like lactoylglutathione lyase family enzyme
LASPRVRGVHHVGFTVGDIDRSSAFYRKYFHLRELGRFSLQGDVLARAVAVPGAELRAVLLATEDDGLVIELLGYVTPDGRPFDRGNNDIGAAHLCFQVDDLAGLVERMTADGLELNAPIQEQVAGTPMIYLRDPDGINIEVLQPGPTLRVADLLAMSGEP